MESGEKKVKRPNYKRSPIDESVKRGERLEPVLKYLIEKDVTVAQLAEKCGVSRQAMNKRLIADNCSLKDMEEMAKAAGYKFVWEWIPDDETR